jgi:phenylalanyl-tRNA synthetase beta chain
MNILTQWLRSYLPELSVTDAQLAEDLTLRGIAVEGIFPAPGGSRFEMDITTNRVDAMNHYGIAREAAAIYNVALAPLDTGVAHSSAASSPMSGVAAFPVRIEARELCGRFTARIIRGVTVKQSTGILADSFAALGQKPISAPVDATNFSWLAMGQPTHVFDLDKLSGGIVVRLARAGEKLHLLDGTERTLTADDLVVADEKQVHGLAGVMGGWDSRVTEATKNILVEAAWFDPAAVRASSRRHGLHTDASHRFERGADFNAATLGNHLVTRLVVEHSGGEVTGPLTDVIVPELAARTANRPAITLRMSEIKRHLGATLDGAEIGEKLVAQYLTALGCKLTASGAGVYKRAASELAARPRARDRSHRRGRPRLRLQQVRRHAAQLRGLGRGAAARRTGARPPRDAARARLQRGRLQHLRG